jgi:hypothetical protein
LYNSSIEHPDVDDLLPAEAREVGIRLTTKIFVGTGD